MTIYEEILAERQRQIVEKNYSRMHDHSHNNEELAQAAAAFACPPGATVSIKVPLGAGEFRLREALWPWEGEPRSGDRRRDLIKSAALLVAEIERLDRDCDA